MKQSAALRILNGLLTCLDDALRRLTKTGELLHGHENVGVPLQAQTIFNKYMSAHNAMFSGIDATSLAQLLSAFVACIGYALAQGGMLASRGKLIALVAMALGLSSFALQGTDWVRTIVLTAFAMVGFGSFAAIVWLMSRALGMDREPIEILESPIARPQGDASPAPSIPGRPRITRPVAST